VKPRWRRLLLRLLLRPKQLQMTHRLLLLLLMLLRMLVVPS
jgi:hypothetical protein